ncbi:MAG: PEP-CTERM sorting domain-containing protein [Bryobacteraceae bacterium]|jgi:hypothetical protein
MAFLLVSVPAFADTLSFDAYSRGWISSAGAEGSSVDIANYYAGIDASFNDGAELRNFFEFDIPSDIMVTSATLDIDVYTVLQYDDTSSENYLLTSLPSSFGFGDLGTGTMYATQSVAPSDAQTTLTITLDAAAISDIEADEGGSFGLGGRITSLVQSVPGSSNEAIFDQSSGDATAVQLILTTSDTGSAVPEPGSWPLFATGLAAMWAVRRARHANSEVTAGSIRLPTIVDIVPGPSFRHDVSYG